ncbi:PREDICTED: uncharacterized protein LOC108570339 isoform X4 [Habropoda laboriosa]|uniref:uncharacterized protein LOC108570339 isoform X4 n=1 Tax=Habropoda laboriosa TaxID=597456 RepID=UPI00083D6AFA|nr:PREDICTED: uncharacterized protein LOC108570339 isoform X4 [Habropoda laboriosa]
MQPMENEQGSNMRLREAVVSLPLRPGGLNNNQLRRSDQNQPITEEIGNRNENTTASTNTSPIGRNRNGADFAAEDPDDFRVAEDTTTWSSLAITRENVQIDSSSDDTGNLNNNLTVPRIRRNSSVESLADYEGRNSSHEDSSHELTPSELSDWSEEGNLPAGCRGIINPNYPGFQHLASSLLSDTDLTEDEHESCSDYTRLNDIDATPAENDNEFNNNVEDSINHLCGQRNDRKIFYEKPKFNIQAEDIVVEHIDLIREAKELPHQARSKIGNRQTVTSNGSADDDSESNTDTDSYPEEQPTYTKLEGIDLLSSIGRDIGVDLEKYVQPVPDVVAMEPLDHVHASSRSSTAMNNMLKDAIEDTNKLLDRDLPEASSADTRKKEKMARNQAKRRQQQQQQQYRASNSQRRPDKRRADTDNGPGGFDVYNIETAMPKIDLDAIESHLRAAREEERRRRNDREEIRRKLAMGPDAEDLRAERGRKPSLQSRLQSGMNLQICFMNETPSDTESPCSENDASPGTTPTTLSSKQQPKQPMPIRPQVLSLPPLRLDTGSNSTPIDEADFFARQARLQTEARMALAQAKEMAHMQMEVERQRLKQSPITEMVRSSLEKVGVQLGEDRRRLSRVLLTELNVAQLQVVANDLHARIAALNEALVEGLLRRDDLHMEQDSMLVDVEDLTRYLGAKQESLKKKQNTREQQTAASRSHQQTNAGQNKLSLKPKLTHRGLVSLVRK